MIYSDIARCLKSARATASSVAQLRMLDRVSHMLADDLAGYNRFNPSRFLDECAVGHGVYLDNTLENDE